MPGFVQIFHSIASRIDDKSTYRIDVSTNS